MAIIQFLTARQVMERWEISEFDLYQAIRGGLQVYTESKNGFVKANSLLSLDFNPEEAIANAAAVGRGGLIPSYFFSKTDVEKLETDHPELQKAIPLDGKERTELGRLRREKENWDKSIKAAVKLTEFCVKHGEPVIEEQGRAFIGSVIPDTTFDKIWKSIPGKYRQGSGRPKKPKKN